MAVLLTSDQAGPPWVRDWLTYHGQQELGVIGDLTNVFIRSLNRGIVYGTEAATISVTEGDEWCNTSNNWFVQQSGGINSGNQLATSSDDQGMDIFNNADPRFGSSILCDKAPTDPYAATGVYHITTFLGFIPSRPGYFYGIGGNQGRAIKVGYFANAEIGDIQFPIGIPTAGPVLTEPDFLGIYNSCYELGLEGFGPDPRRTTGTFKFEPRIIRSGIHVGKWALPNSVLTNPLCSDYHDDLALLPTATLTTENLETDVSIALSSTSVAKAAASGTVVGTLSVDLGTDTYTYSLEYGREGQTTGNPGNFTIVGNELRVNTVSTTDAVNSKSIRILADNNLDFTVTRNVTITLT